jgi:hypothetical protein
MTQIVRAKQPAITRVTPQPGAKRILSPNTFRGLQINKAPVNTINPVIGLQTGVAVGNVLIVNSFGAWSAYPAPNFTFQWQRNAADIVGQIGQSYTLQIADQGTGIRCVVTATNVQGASSANSNTIAIP